MNSRKTRRSCSHSLLAFTGTQRLSASVTARGATRRGEGEGAGLAFRFLPWASRPVQAGVERPLGNASAEAASPQTPDAVYASHGAVSPAAPLNLLSSVLEINARVRPGQQQQQQWPC
jgi:hypothetical protein